MFAVTPFHRFYGSSPLSHLLSVWLELPKPQVGLEEHLEQTGMAYLPPSCPEAKQDGLQGVCRVLKCSGVMVLPLEGHF